MVRFITKRRSLYAVAYSGTARRCRPAIFRVMKTSRRFIWGTQPEKIPSFVFCLVSASPWKTMKVWDIAYVGWQHIPIGAVKA